MLDFSKGRPARNCGTFLYVSLPIVPPELSCPSYDLFIFFHGEHDKLYIGSDFDIFQDFTKEDVRRAILYGLDLSDVDGGFQINASM